LVSVSPTPELSPQYLIDIVDTRGFSNEPAQNDMQRAAARHEPKKLRQSYRQGALRFPTGPWEGARELAPAFQFRAWHCLKNLQVQQDSVWGKYLPSKLGVNWTYVFHKRGHSSFGKYLLESSKLIARICGPRRSKIFSSSSLGRAEIR